MTTIMIPVRPDTDSPPPDPRLARALAYCAGRRRQLDRATYMLPRILAILPDASDRTLEQLVDVIAGAPAALFDGEDVTEAV